jgi:hypothetical protein
MLIHHGWAKLLVIININYKSTFYRILHNTIVELCNITPNNVVGFENVVDCTVYCNAIYWCATIVYSARQENALRSAIAFANI